MRKVMIVDDESLVRIGLQSMIPWEDNGYEIAGVFRNGEEALEAARKMSFDIVLTDIRMPGMSGLELITELKQLNHRMQFIILSSYSDFEYTRQAIQLGVKDYMSKYELEPDELFRVLNGLTFNDQNQDLQPEHRDSSEQYVNRAGERSEATFTQLVDGGWMDEKQRVLELSTWHEIDSFTEHFPLLEQWKSSSNDQLRWIVLLPKSRHEGYAASERKAMLLLAEEMFDRLRNPILFGENGKEYGLHGGLWVQPEQDERLFKEMITVMATEWMATFQQSLNISLTVAVGDICEAIKECPRSRKEAEQAAKAAFFRGSGIYLYEDTPALGVFCEEEWLGLHKQIRQQIQFLQFDRLANELIAQLEAERDARRPSEWLRLFSMAASQIANALIEEIHMDAEEIRLQFGGLWPLPEAIASAMCQQELTATFSKIAKLAADAVARRQSSRSWVARVKEYVELNYHSAIRLEDAAELVNFSVNHFSQRFRQETGEAFSDYVTRIRIKEAIRYYQETDLSTEEIAARVGYMNANYFIKVFKRATGKTIKSFKKDMIPDQMEPKS